MEETRKVIPMNEARRDVVENPGMDLDSEETRKSITFEEFEEIMTANERSFFVDTDENPYGLIINMSCESGNFEFDKTAEGKCMGIIFAAKSTARLEIEAETINEIYLTKDDLTGKDKIIIELTINMSDLEITFQLTQSELEEI